uniref:Dynein light chain n=1 Tax=Globodera rostochiensis TaxID=31243 RepID=A0A914HXD4_GLORO
MPLLDARSDRKVREAEVFYCSELMAGTEVVKICNLAYSVLQMDCPMMEMARALKMDLEKELPGRGWTVVIGKTFGAYLTVDARNFLHFRIGRTYFVLHRQQK